MKGDIMSGLVIELSDAQFKKEVESSDIPVMVDFWASWCGPCTMMAPIVEEAAKEYKDKCRFAKVNIEENQSVASDLGIMTIPTFVFFKKGKEISRFSGAVQKRELTKRIEAAIGA